MDALFERSKQRALKALRLSLLSDSMRRAPVVNEGMDAASYKRESSSNPYPHWSGKYYLWLCGYCWIRYGEDRRNGHEILG